VKLPEKDLPKTVKKRRIAPILEGFVYHSPNVPLKTYGRKQRKEGNDESSKSKQSVPGATVAEQKVVSSSTSFEEEMEICPEQLFNDKSFSNQVGSSAKLGLCIHYYFSSFYEDKFNEITAN